MNFLLNGIISGIKNIVIIIISSEFLKSFLIGESFKKYITVCVNIIVIAFTVCELKNIPFEVNTDFTVSDYAFTENRNIIKEEYERETTDVLRKKLKEEKILVYDIHIEANEDYSIKKVVVSINENKEKADNIIKGMKPESYEINGNNE